MDMSAEERFRQTSMHFRRKLWSWLGQHVGDDWEAMSHMARDAANYCGASMQWAGKWIFQYTGPGQPWQLIQGEDGITLASRGLTKAQTERLWEDMKPKTKREG